MRRLWLTALSVTGIGLIAACQQTAGVYFGPYVTDVQGTSAKILWVTPGGAADSAVVVERDAAVKTRRVPIPGQHETLHVATVTGLGEGTNYHYMVVLKNGGGLVGDRAGEFVTPPPTGSVGPIHFVVYGDTRTYPDRHREVSEAAAAEHPEFVVQSGDLTSNGTLWPQWKRQYFDPAEELLRHTTMWAAPGNHEMDGALYKLLFDEKKSYYSFDFGNVHFVALNSELGGGKKPDPEMLKWLERDLLASKAEWKLVSYHRPTFDVITHRTTWGQADLLPILERCGADIVMAGHTHNYQRFRPIGVEQGKPVIFVISAGGGAPNYPVNPGAILEKSYSGLHYCVFDVNGNTLEMTAKRPDGYVLDHFKLVKNGGTYQREVLDRAVTTDFARESAFLVTGLYAHSPAPPEAGQPFTLLISPLTLPEGATVELASAVMGTPAPGEIVQGTWTVPAVTLRGFKGRVGVDEDHPDGEYAPLLVRVYAPPDLVVSEKGFSPGLRVSMRVTYQGKTYVNPSAGVFFRTPTLRSWEAQREAAALGAAAFTH